MNEIADGNDAATRRGLGVRVTGRLRELTVQLSLLNHQVAARAGIQDVDLDCLDIVSREGPLTPSALARKAGLHPATTTGVIDRLEKAGWVRRERVPTDRRAVHITFIPDRAGEILGLYAPMATAIGEICQDYSPAELEAIGSFLERATGAGLEATAIVSERG
ncbi:MarR family transcriptional regulator [Glycomyces buryatensis]|uniref:MarR family transcriptional regulator n=1 Tax=Glycomyces buryatensis TaxID=2570927 RepID=A0A4V4HQD0_9ACTN|nr:MarR family transcriptional regulator [Glycomyces buryatensis]THV33436.1 MarR family transcriptional regulator [Glycomyces buryatensis]